jgi:hypothetical protein
VTSIITNTITAATAAAAAAKEAGSSCCMSNLHRLLSSLLYAEHVAPAARDSDAVMHRLLPAMKVALQAGMHEEAGKLVKTAGCCLSSSNLMVLLQAALQLDKKGRSVEQVLLSVPAADSLDAEHILQLLRCSSALLEQDARRALKCSKAWSSIRAQDKLVELLPVLLPWLSMEECKQCLQAASLTAEKTAALAATASFIWAAKPSALADCSCMSKLQAGSPVQRCTRPWTQTCAAVQLSEVLLPALSRPETKQPVTHHTADNDIAALAMRYQTLDRRIQALRSRYARRGMKEVSCPAVHPSSSTSASLPSSVSSEAEQPVTCCTAEPDIETLRMRYKMLQRPMQEQLHDPYQTHSMSVSCTAVHHNRAAAAAAAATAAAATTSPAAGPAGITVEPVSCIAVDPSSRASAPAPAIATAAKTVEPLSCETMHPFSRAPSSVSPDAERPVGPQLSRP